MSSAHGNPIPLASPGCTRQCGDGWNSFFFEIIRLSFAVSHPFRTEREMDGARSICGAANEWGFNFSDIFRLGVVVSHPFRKKRGKDGARSICGDKPNF